MSEEKLAGFLKTGKDWGRLRTSVPGVFVLKLPPYRGATTRLVVEANPVDETGSPTKRRGLVLRSTAELEDFQQIFRDEKLSKLISIVDSVNPKVETGKRKRGEEEVLEL